MAFSTTMGGKLLNLSPLDDLDRREGGGTSMPGSSKLGGCRVCGTDGIPKEEIPEKEILMDYVSGPKW